jgi:hypothetical protein
MDKRLEKIKEGRKCKRLPSTATKQERREAHLIKMAAKKILRERMYASNKTIEYVPANLGVDHPDYGMNWAEHSAEKDNRQHVL